VNQANCLGQINLAWPSLHGRHDKYQHMLGTQPHLAVHQPCINGFVVSGWRLQKWRSATLYEPMQPEKYFSLLHILFSILSKLAKFTILACVFSLFPEVTSDFLALLSHFCDSNNYPAYCSVSWQTKTDWLMDSSTHPWMDCQDMIEWNYQHKHPESTVLSSVNYNTHTTDKLLPQHDKFHVIL